MLNGRQFLLPYIICPRTEICGDIAVTVGQSFFIAWVSATVSVAQEPDPLFMPLLVTGPGHTRIVFTPISEKLFSSATCAPLPISITAITAAMPMTMPRVVKNVLVGFRAIDLSAHFNTRNLFISLSPYRRIFPRLRAELCVWRCLQRPFHV